MGNVTTTADRMLGVGEVVPLVETEVLLDVRRWIYEACIEQDADRLFVMPVRRSEDSGQGDAGGVGQMVALGAALGAVGSGWGRFFSPPSGALCSDASADCHFHAIPTSSS